MQEYEFLIKVNPKEERERVFSELEKVIEQVEQHERQTLTIDKYHTLTINDEPYVNLSLASNIDGNDTYDLLDSYLTGNKMFLDYSIKEI